MTPAVRDLPSAVLHAELLRLAKHLEYVARYDFSLTVRDIEAGRGRGYRRQAQLIREGVRRVRRAS